MYTLGQAATATGKTKSTLSNAIKKGRLSAKKNDKGQWEIDPGELHRVYKPSSSNSAKKSEIERSETLDKTEVYEAKLEALSKQVTLLERMNDDLREDRNKWRQQATALLTHEQEKPPVKVGWFDRLLGRA